MITNPYSPGSWGYTFWNSSFVPGGQYYGTVQFSGDLFYGTTGNGTGLRPDAIVDNTGIYGTQDGGGHGGAWTPPTGSGNTGGSNASSSPTGASGGTAIGVRSSSNAVTNYVAPVRTNPRNTPWTGITYSEEEANESGIISGKATTSGGRNVGGLVRGEKDVDLYLPYQHSDDARAPERDPTIYDDGSENIGGNITSSVMDNPDAAGPGSSAVNMPNAGATVSSTGQGIGQGIKNYFTSDDRWWNSDIKLKKEIKRIGISKKGYEIYSFKFKDPEKSGMGKGTYQGVLSHKIPKKFITKSNEGYDMVDYSAIDVDFKKIT